ncbi:MAG TPA: hypothetical protein VNF49_12560 [Candidatus Binataceae bacterium]|nr:hypothetical protein [Candidatus Binataceae bacterium]
MNAMTRRGGRARWALRAIPLAAVGCWLLVASASADCSYDENGVGYGDTCQNENSNGAGGYRAPAPNYNYYYQQQMMRHRQMMLQRQQYLQQQKELQLQKAQARAAAKARFIAGRNAAAASLKGDSCCSNDGLKTGTGSALFHRRNSNPHLRGEGPIGSSGSTASDNLKAWAGASDMATRAHSKTGASTLAGLTPDTGGGFAAYAVRLMRPPPTPPSPPVVSERVARDPKYRALTAKMQQDRQEAQRDQNRVNELIAKKARANGADLENIEVDLAKASNELSTAQNKAATDDVLRTDRAKQG